MKMLLMITVMLSIAVPQALAGERKYANGFWSADDQSFWWTNAGGDPLRISFREALSQERVREVMSKKVMEALLAKMEQAQAGQPNYHVKESDRYDLMFSGDGWIAHKVVAITPQWKQGVSRKAWVVYHTDPVTGEQWRMTVFEACDNIGLDLVNAPQLVCRCEPERGDACVDG